MTIYEHIMALSSFSLKKFHNSAKKVVKFQKKYGMINGDEEIGVFKVLKRRSVIWTSFFI